MPRAVAKWFFSLIVRGFNCGAGSGVSLSSQMAFFHAHTALAAFWCLLSPVQDCRESSRSWAFSCRRRTLIYQWRFGMLTGKQTVVAPAGLRSSGIPRRFCLNEVQSSSSVNLL